MCIMMIIRRGLFFLSLLLFLQNNSAFADQPQLLAEGNKMKEKWITIFIHGSYGTSLTLMSFPKIFRGDSQGTLYKKFQSRFRDNKDFYQNRFMPALGLIPVGDLHHQKGSHAAEIIANSLVGFYEEVGKHLNPNLEEWCYAYGWSGLLNQYERKLAAIELYNRLVVLYEEFKQAGIMPKVRLVSHSHGGNVGLNLAAVHEVASKKASFIIDELIMYATPIQQETECFCFSPLFQKVFNIYSENDAIQPSDFVSTSMRKCSRRIEINNYPELDHSRLTQIQITVDRPILDLSAAPGKKNLNVKGALRGGLLYSRSPKDPAHADFWCVAWDKHDVFYDPLPLVVFTPVFIKLLSQKTGYQDMVINITKKQGRQKGGGHFMLIDKQGESANSAVLPLPFIKKMRDALYKIQSKKSVYSLSFGNLV